MIVLVDIQGTASILDIEPLRQGSIDANKVYILAPFPTSTVCTAAYVLPNGVYTEPALVGAAVNEQGAYEATAGNGISLGKGWTDEEGNVLNLWVMKLSRPVTDIPGTLGIQLFFNTSSETIPTNIINRDISRGAIYNIKADDFKKLAGMLSWADENLISAANKAQRYATGTYTDENGEIKPVESGSVGYNDNAKYYAKNAGSYETLSKRHSQAAKESEDQAKQALSDTTEAKNATRAIYNDVLALSKNVGTPYNLVITESNYNANAFNVSTGTNNERHILVKDCVISHNHTVSNNVRSIRFIDCTFFSEDEGLTITGHSNCSISGISVTSTKLSLLYFNGVSNCRGVYLKNCSHIENCTFYDNGGCQYVSSSHISNFSASSTFVSPFTNIGIAANIENFSGTVPVLAEESGKFELKRMPANLSVNYDSRTHEISLYLTDIYGGMLGTKHKIDLPLESVVMNLEYDDSEKSIVLTLQNGNTVKIPIVDITNGLASVEYVDERFTYDKTFSTWEELEAGIAYASGKILVKNVAIKDNFTVPSTVSQIDFFDCSKSEETGTPSIAEIIGSTATISGLNGLFALKGFSYVKDCKVRAVTDCKNVVDSTIEIAYNCSLTNVNIVKMTDIPASNIQYSTVNGAFCEDGLGVSFLNCNGLSNISGTGIISYDTCKYVDPFTCVGYVSDTDEGKVQVLSSDGSYSAAKLPGDVSVSLEEDRLAVKLTNQDGTETDGSSVSLDAYAKNSDIDHLYDVLEFAGIIGEKKIAATATSVDVPTNLESPYAIINKIGGMTYQSDEELDLGSYSVGNMIPYPYKNLPEGSTDYDGVIYYKSDAPQYPKFEFVDPNHPITLSAGFTYKLSSGLQEISGSFSSRWTYTTVDGENVVITTPEFTPETTVEIKSLLLQEDGHGATEFYLRPFLSEVNTIDSSYTYFDSLYPRGKKLVDTKVTSIRSYGVDGLLLKEISIPDEYLALDNYGKGVPGYPSILDFENGIYTAPYLKEKAIENVTFYYPEPMNLVIKGFAAFGALDEDYNFQSGVSTHGYVAFTNLAKDNQIWLGSNNKTIYWHGISNLLGLTYANVTPTDEEKSAALASMNIILSKMTSAGISPKVLYKSNASADISGDLPEGVVFNNMIPVEPGGTIEFITNTGKPVDVEVEFRVVGEGGATI